MENNEEMKIDNNDADGTEQQEEDSKKQYFQDLLIMVKSAQN